MKAAARAHIRPFWLRGARGPLMAIYYSPAAEASPRGDILFVPPFAEEMNRCRAMVALQARALSRIGIGTLVLDPFGTGDSSGDFSEASWGSWRDDLKRGVDWLRAHANGCRALWGIRLGAVMAADLAAEDSGISRLLLWQPVTNGKNYFTQFLRIRIAAEMQSRDGVKTTDELRRQSAAGEAVEVSGYRIGPDLARTMDQVRLPEAAAFSSLRLSWFDVLPAAETPSANAKVVDDYKSNGVALDYRSVIGPAFWQMHERTLAPALLEATLEAVSAWDGSGGQSIAEPPGALDEVVSDQPPGSESPLLFECEHDDLVAILHRANPWAPAAKRGVVIVVAGGPQYRVGAHRQFVSLARRLSDRGYPVLRFDLRGMGDSGGTHLGYQHSGPDIRAAIDTLTAEEPQLDEVVLFGECESASGILFYAYQDPRVKGIALVNPWVRTEEGQAQVILKHYYVTRLLSRAFWRKLGSGKFSPRASVVSFAQVLRTYLQGRKSATSSRAAPGQDDMSKLPLPLKTAEGLRRFGGQTMILMSGRDFIAREFDEVVASSKAWQQLLADARVRRRVLADADHTFSREVWKVQVFDWIAEWLGSW
jgi:exosortase A-associated hydrolase 1/exosortase A-associated hydrolase 2